MSRSSSLAALLGSLLKPYRTTVALLALVAFGLISVYSASSYVAQVKGLEDSHYLFQRFVDLMARDA